MSAAVIRAGAREKAARVTLLLLDADGVLTDGGIVYMIADAIESLVDKDGFRVRVFPGSGEHFEIVLVESQAHS